MLIILFFLLKLILLIAIPVYFISLFVQSMQEDRIIFPLYILIISLLGLGFLHILSPIIIGLVGVALALGITFFLNIGVLSTDNINYPLMQISTTLLMVYSMLLQFNLPFFIMEIAYGSIALLGAIRIMRTRRKKRS